MIGTSIPWGARRGLIVPVPSSHLTTRVTSSPPGGTSKRSSGRLSGIDLGGVGGPPGPRELSGPRLQAGGRARVGDARPRRHPPFKGHHPPWCRRPDLARVLLRPRLIRTKLSQRHPPPHVRLSPDS